MMPVLNEQSHLVTNLESVIRQTVQPSKFIIIDGGSTDRTFETLTWYSKIYPWIIPIQQTNYHGEAGHKKISCAMLEAYQKMQSYNEPVMYIGHIDADFLLEPDVFENLIKELESDFALGAVGGILYTDGTPEIYPEDELPNLRLYRKKALDQIGGYPYSKHSWDSVILAKLRMKGWKIRACQTAIVTNLRSGESTNKNKWSTAVSFGKARYYLGYSLLLFFAGTVYATKNNGIIFGLGLIAGYFGSITQPKTNDIQIRNYYKNTRLKEILLEKKA